MSPSLRRRLRAAVPSAVLAAVIFVPLLLTRPGRVGADTKTYLYLDPGRLLERAPSMWDPNIGMGTVTHQNIGYLWPIGPYYWLTDALGVPDWVAQRLWLGAILFLAGLGVRYMLRTMGQEGPHVTAATFCYALTPYALTLGARLSVILLPFAGLPWLIGLTVRSLRRRRWREPALFALVVATIGSVNATALILVGTGPLLWVLHEVAIAREVRFRDAAAAVGRIGAITTACSLWWLSGLWTQSGYGIEILRYTETAETVATASVSLEVLRGLGYWFFYGEDRFGPWIAASRAYLGRLDVLVASFVLPVLGIVGAVATRFRERAFFVALLVLGLLLAIGGHPWEDAPPAPAAVRAFLLSDVGLSMRSLPRAAPLVVLALSVFTGSLLAAVTATRPRLARPLVAGVIVLAVLALPPLWRGQLVDANLDRAEELPAYWPEAAAALDARDDGTRVLEVPGSDFASYRWGNTVDPVLPGLMDRPYVARELIPYGSPPSADLLNAFDRRLQEATFEPGSLAPIARLMAAGDVSVRSDLSYERYNTPRPRVLWDQLRNAPGVGEELGFGPGEPNRPRPELPLLDEAELATDPDLPHPPEVGVLAIDDAPGILRTISPDRPVVVAGNGEGLVDMAAADLVRGDELIVYAGTYANDPEGLAGHVDRDAVLVLTDTNRREARRWGTVRDNTGITERAGEDPIVDDPKDQRLELFPDADDSSATVRHTDGPVWAQATGYGNSVSLTPEDDPMNAIDGDPTSAWRTGGFDSATGQTLRLVFTEPVTTDRVRVLQAFGGVRNRTIDSVDLSFDEGPATGFDLDESSRPEAPDLDEDPDPGQVLTFAESTFTTLDLTITATDPDGLRRHDGISPVGFAEVAVAGPDGETLVADDVVVRLPTDLLAAVGPESQDHPLAVVLTRQRVAPSVAVRSDPERSMSRSLELPGTRSFALTGQVRLSDGAVADDVIDRAIGLPGADEGGVTATSSRRLPGGLTKRAMAAIDGDPETWWSPGFLGQQREFVRYETSRPVTVDRFEVTVLNDGRHSVPRSLLVEVVDAAGEVQATEISLGDVADQPEPDARHTFSVELDEPLVGADVRVSVPDRPDAVRDVVTIDWFTGDPVTTPIGIVELGIDGLAAPAAADEIDPACRDDLLALDGNPVGVSLDGTVDDLLAGHPIDLELCPGTDLTLPAGSSTLTTASGAFTGLDLDRLVLRSSPGGGPDTDTGALVGADARDEPQTLAIDEAGRTSIDLRVTDAGDDYWLVLGQSFSEGWRATADGEDLGPPTLVNGYANGWLVPAGAGADLHLTWTPQRVVDVALAVSALSVLVALALVARPRRRVPDDAPSWVPLDRRPSMPRPLDPARILRYAGPQPSRPALFATTAAALAAGIALIGPAAGIGLAALAALVLRVPRARPIVSLGGPILVVAAVALVATEQWRQDLPPGFDWPTYFEHVHVLGLLAVLLVVLDVVVDRCWLRRWWPSDDSPR